MRGFIWSKGLRDAVREGAVKRYFELKRRRNEPQPASFPHYLAVVAIVKDEAPYIAEWIAYHHLNGATKFYIYDNESTDGIADVLEPFIKRGLVEYTYWPGLGQQTNAYQHALLHHEYDARWMAFLDIDEFAVAMRAPTLASFLRDYEAEAGVAMNWLVYGDGGHKSRKPGLVMERFTSHSLASFERNKVFKSVVNPRRCVFMSVHYGRFVGAEAEVNSAYEKVQRVGLAPVYDKVRVNHYWGKSFEEWQVKRFRGSVADGDTRPLDREKFDYYNRNEVAGDSAMAKWAARVKKYLGE
jgi:hypothetical protein